MLFLLTIGLEAADPPEMILVIIDQCGLESIVNAPTNTINKLQKIGAFGLMNVRTAGELKPESTYLTAGNGKKCKGSKYTHSGEYSGNRILNRKIDEIKKINANTNYRPFIGLLGKVCKENKKGIAIFGNTDTTIQRRRTVVSLAMDENGYVDSGDISNKLLKKTDLPWGYITNWDVLKEKLMNSLNDTNLIIVETGDTARIDSYYEQLTEYEILKYKSDAIIYIDDFISYLVKNINLEETVLGIVSLSPSTANLRDGNKLTWALFAGKGVEHGWLTSDTTRRKGIITITDILPAVFNLLTINTNNINADRISGHKIGSLKANVGWNDLLKLNKRITVISELRTPFIQLFIALQLLVIIMAIICIYYKRLYSSLIIQYSIEYLLLTLFLIPVNFLLISLFNFSFIYNYLLILIFLSILEIFILTKLYKNSVKKISIISFILVLVIIIDLINDNFLMADSLLGYSSIIGARFYGLGNEYMGLFIGSAIISITGFIESKKTNNKRRYIWSIAFPGFCILIYFTGAPNLGANFGGTITATVVSTVSWFYLHSSSLNIKRLLSIIIILILVIGGIVYLDYNQFITSRTHIGQAVEPLISGSYQEIEDIIIRKIKMNIKLMKWTIWTRVLLAFLVYIIILFKHPVGQLKKLFSRYPCLAAGFYGGISGSVITLLVNDSGVVASATMLFYPMLGLLYILNELNRKENNLFIEERGE